MAEYFNGSYFTGDNPESISATPFVAVVDLETMVVVAMDQGSLLSTDEIMSAVNAANR